MVEPTAMGKAPYSGDLTTVSLDAAQIGRVTDYLAEGLQEPIVAGSIITAILAFFAPWLWRRSENAARLVLESHKACETDRTINRARRKDEWVWRRLLKYPMRRKFRSSGPTHWSDETLHMTRTSSPDSDDLRTIPLYMHYSFFTQAKKKMSGHPILRSLDDFAGRYMMATHLPNLTGATGKVLAWHSERPEAMVTQVQQIEHWHLERSFMLELGDFQIDPVGYASSEPATSLRDITQQFADGPTSQRRWRRKPFRLLPVLDSRSAKTLNSALRLVEDDGTKVYLCCRSPEQAQDMAAQLNGSRYLRDVEAQSSQLSLVPNPALYLYGA